MKYDPIQIYEKVLNATGTFNTYWQTYFRNQSKNLIDSQTITSASFVSASNSSCQYCLNGNLLTLNYSGNSETIIKLPYKIAENQVINYWESGVLKQLDISKGDLTIKIPNGIIKFTATILVRQS